MERTTCCIVGGGPAGMVLGLLLARSGVEVTVLEKHGDFLRDFRGDTVHPTTLQLLDDLGLAERFAELPQRRIGTVQFPLAPNGELFTVGDIASLPTKYNYIAMVPQWDLLDLLADVGKQEPTFALRMNTEAVSFLDEDGRVSGVRYRTSDGETGEIRATITVACDGRNSLVRERSELGLREFPCPMDAWWFRLPRYTDDPSGLVGNVGDKLFSVLIDRGDYWQCAAIIPKGNDAPLRAQGIDTFLDEFTRHSTWLRDRKDALRSWDDVKLLDVRLDRLRKWHRPGLLCLGDAAHAMSPVGGIGINLAVQDAVAAARHLAEPLRNGRLRRHHVTAIQRRRWLTTALIQGFQRIVHARVVKPILDGDVNFVNPPKPLLAYRAISRMPWLRKVPAYLISYGAMRERPPASAVRPQP
jgi:2-polyprenyl-6-methoxyphenol hydroxylase-like FAD-dependent oxidoreductase